MISEATTRNQIASHKRITMLFIAVSVLAVLFGGYMFFANTKTIIAKASELATESSQLEQARKDAEELDLEGNYHRIQGTKIIQTFSAILEIKAKARGLTVSKATPGDDIDAYQSLSGGTPSVAGWGVIKFEFEMRGSVREMHALIKELATIGLPFELEVVDFRLEKAGNNRKEEVRAVVIANLVTRASIKAKQSGPQQPGGEIPK